MQQTNAFTLSQLSTYISAAIAAKPELQGVWIVGETADVRIVGGHCYLELIEKDPEGRITARARATIWASLHWRLARVFAEATGQQFGSDMKVMVLATANYHPVYGLSLNIQSINPSYTLGDALQRRNEMIKRLTSEGVIDLNKKLTWPAPALRIAVVSARGAAGYGDFINQLYRNPARLRFATKLFPALMQGESAPASIIAALNAINNEAGNWDCVVIIRGGGASSDLAAYDSYELASNVAQFPLPVIIGIGHERDVTLLDYVANMRVKTPTAAAEWLIEGGRQALGHLHDLASDMLRAAKDRMEGCHRQLAYYAGLLPAAAQAAIARAQRRLFASQTALSAVADRRLRPLQARLDAMEGAIRQCSSFALRRAAQKLDSLEQLAKALSPEATLRRGYTITRLNGRALSAAAELRPGDTIETQFANGTSVSTINTTNT